MSQPDPGAMHVNRPLTNMSLAYIQDQSDFVADEVFPVIPSEKQSDIYFTFPKEYFLRDQVKERAPGTESEAAGYEIGQDSFLCKVYGLNHPIPDERRVNTDSPLNADRNGAQLLTSLGWIKKEKLWRDAFFTTGVWTKDVTGVAAAPVAGTSVLQWNDASATPIPDIAYYQEYMKQRTGKKPMHLVIGPTVWKYLKTNATILARILYGNNGKPAVVTKQAVAAMMEIEQIYVSEAIENTAKEGQTGAYSFILGKHALLFYKPPAPGIETASAGYTFTWKGLFGMTDAGFRISKYREQRKKSDIIDLDMAFVHKAVATDLGVFFNGIVA